MIGYLYLDLDNIFSLNLEPDNRQSLERRERNSMKRERADHNSRTCITLHCIGKRSHR